MVIDGILANAAAVRSLRPATSISTTAWLARLAQSVADDG